MWRRVSCEQPLNTSQSILSLSRKVNQVFGDFFFKEKPKVGRKGNWFIFQYPVAEPFGPSSVRGNATRLGDAHRSSGKSCLFCISHRVPGILSQGEWVLVLAKSAAVLAASTSARWDLENPREITCGIAPARTHIRSRSPRLTASGR